MATAKYPMDPLEGCKVSGRYQGLERCLAYYLEEPERFHPAAVHAARSGAWSDDAAPPEWVKRLDALERVFVAFNMGMTEAVLLAVEPANETDISHAAEE